VRRLVLDTNVLVRALFPGEESQSRRAAEFLAGAESGGVRLLLTPVVVAEVIYVAQSHFGAARGAIAAALIDLLSHRAVRCAEREILQDALGRYARSRVDFADCYLAAVALGEDAAVCSFDRDFSTFGDIRREEP
jgi:predicted nucleic acid-binding protein